jgi:methionine synthase II (cobalamin-independent)
LRVGRRMTKVIGVTGGTDGRSILRPGAVTSIGSLPHTDPAEAAAFVLAAHPELPAAPQLPRRSRREGMIAQAARGITGVSLTGDADLVVDVDRLDPDAPVTVTFDAESHAGLLAFVDAAAGRTHPVKLQLTGPVTLALALADAGAPVGLGLDVAAAAVRAQAEALVALVRSRLPEAPLLVVLDEPGLARVAGAQAMDVDLEDVVDRLSSALAVVEEHAVTGVHCCGQTEWQLASSAGATVLSMPVEREWLLAGASAINAHLERGGWVAWGVVPTHEPVGPDPDRLWRRLSAVWCELVQAGCDPIQLRTQALVTPACGLAGHGIPQAAHALELASKVAERVTDQAVAVRLSAGA